MDTVDPQPPPFVVTVEALGRVVCVAADSDAAFAERTGAIAFDAPGAPIAHDGERCSFDALIAASGQADTALQRLAGIVRGADTDRCDLAPAAAGLLAIPRGLSLLHDDDTTMLAHAMTLHDALYAHCRATLRREGATGSVR